MKLIWYNRDEFSDQDMAQAKAVANRLQNKKRADPATLPFFSGDAIQFPIMYGNSENHLNNTPRQTPMRKEK